MNTKTPGPLLPGQSQKLARVETNKPVTIPTPVIPAPSPLESSPAKIAELQRTISPHSGEVLSPTKKPKYSAISNVDLSDKNTVKQLLETLRLVSFLQGLPASEEENPELFSRVREYLDRLIKDGALVLYDNDAKIHDEKPNCMQIILHSTVKMVHNRYSLKIPILEKIGFRGPEYKEGDVLASWLTAGNTGEAPFGVMETIGPVLALVLNGNQYEELIRLTLEQPGFATKLKTVVSDNEMEILKTNGLIRTYTYEENFWKASERIDLKKEKDDFYIVVRQRDFDKFEVNKLKEIKSLLKKELNLSDTDPMIERIDKAKFEEIDIIVKELNLTSILHLVDHLKEIKALWKNLDLANTDFIIRENGQQFCYRHEMQCNIKEGTPIQHILQKNFLYSIKELKSPDRNTQVAGAMETPLVTEEMLALSRNIQSVNKKEITVKERDISKQIYFVVFKEADVENPKQPLKTFKGEKLPGNIHVSISLGESESDKCKYTIPIPPHGVVDPEEILSSLKKKYSLSDSAKIEELSMNVNDDKHDMQIYRLDLPKYHEELGGSGYYSWTTMVHDKLEKEDYAFKNGQKEKLIALFDEAKDILECPKPEATLLNYKVRRELLTLMDLWINRDLRERRSGKPIIDDAKINEIGTMLAIYLKGCGRTLNDTFSHYEELQRTALNNSDPKKQAWARTVELLAHEHLEPGYLHKLSPDKRAHLNYKDEKAIAERYNDSFHRDQVVIGLLSEALKDVDVEWSKHEAKEMLIIPDRHQNLWGFINELKAMKVRNADGSLCIENMRGKRLVFMGDGISRQVSQNGLGILLLIDNLIDEARQLNLGETPENKIDLEMIIGNHELDILKMSDEEIERKFPGLGERIIAKHTKDLIQKMVLEGKIKLATYAGDCNNPEDRTKHATITHTLLLPSVRTIVMQELPPEKRNDLELVDHMNNILLEAVKKDITNPSPNNYQHIVFVKSELRGGPKGQQFSGPIEANAIDSPGSDLNAEISEQMGILSPKGKLLIDRSTAEQIVKEAIGNQIIAHNFSYEHPFICSASALNGLIKLPGVILSDSGCNQIPTDDPRERISALHINKGVSKALKADTRPGPPRLETEPDVENLYRGKMNDFLKNYLKELQEYIDKIEKLLRQ